VAWPRSSSIEVEATIGLEVLRDVSRTPTISDSCARSQHDRAASSPAYFVRNMAAAPQRPSYHCQHYARREEKQVEKELMWVTRKDMMNAKNLVIDQPFDEIETPQPTRTEAASALPDHPPGCALAARERRKRPVRTRIQHARWNKPSWVFCRSSPATLSGLQVAVVQTM
jgi:hypothetical protein